MHMYTRTSTDSSALTAVHIVRCACSFRWWDLGAATVMVRTVGRVRSVSVAGGQAHTQEGSRYFLPGDSTSWNRHG